jgi:hypothetical protein
MLLRLRADGAIVDQRQTGNFVGAVVDQNSRIREISIRVQVAYADLGDLARSTSDRVLMAFRARRSVKHRTESQAGVFPPFEYRLIEGKRISRRPRYSVIEALRTGDLVRRVGVSKAAGASVGDC